MEGLFDFKLDGNSIPIGKVIFEQRNEKDAGGNPAASDNLLLHSYSGREEYGQGFRNAKVSVPRANGAKGSVGNYR